MQFQITSPVVASTLNCPSGSKNDLETLSNIISETGKLL
jgi:hypothetical protein